MKRKNKHKMDICLNLYGLLRGILWLTRQEKVLGFNEKII